jgi:hypothetical protein
MDAWTAPVRMQEAAMILAGWPRLLSSLLAEHVAGPDGRCRGCVRGVRGAPRSPCRLADLAEVARAFSEANTREQLQAPAHRRG